MTQKYIKTLFNIEVANRIQSGAIPGWIICDLYNLPCNIVDFSYSDSEIMVMVPDKNLTAEALVFNHKGVCLDEANHCKLYLIVPEWTTFRAGDIVYCQQGYGENSIECISILACKPECISNAKILVNGIVNCITYSNYLPSRAMLEMKFSVFHSVRRAGLTEKRLLAERMIQNGSEDALKMLRKYIPEYKHLAPSLNNKTDE